MHTPLSREFSLGLLFCAVLLTPTSALAQWNVFGSPQSNKLAIGQQAKVPGTIDVRIHSAMDFNKKTKAEILAIRKQRAVDQPALLAGDYVPSTDVFGQIVDGRPWWGVQGVLLGAGNDASIGTALHSTGICNPFALMLPEAFSDYTYNTSRFPTKLDFAKSGYPSRCAPDRLVWNPKASSAVVTYNMTRHLALANTYTRAPIKVSDLTLNFDGYNARDFGFNYCAMDSSKSSNLTGGPLNKVVQIVHYFHCGPSCGIPGGCNNMSPTIADLEKFNLTALPAKCQINLWRDKPPSTMRTPDFSYLIEFR